jgi:hypothetical protein
MVEKYLKLMQLITNILKLTPTNIKWTKISTTKFQPLLTPSRDQNRTLTSITQTKEGGTVNKSLESFP